MIKITTDFTKVKQTTKMKGALEDVMGEIVYSLFEQMIPQIENQEPKYAIMVLERIEKLSKEKIKQLKWSANDKGKTLKK